MSMLQPKNLGFDDVRSPTRASGRHPRRATIGCELLEVRRRLPSPKEDVLQLAQDLLTIHEGSEVTADQIWAVASDLSATARVAIVPDPTTVDTLMADVRNAVEDGAIQPVEAATPAGDVRAILADSAH
jgi:hypothetical protein